MIATDGRRRARHLCGLRGWGVILAALALLAYVNLSEADADAEAALRSTSYVESTAVDAALAQRRDAVAWYVVGSYAALAAGAIGFSLATLGPVTRRARRRVVAERCV